jgi:hypothetical protein
MGCPALGLLLSLPLYQRRDIPGILYSFEAFRTLLAKALAGNEPPSIHIYAWLTKFADMTFCFPVPPEKA